MEEVVYLDFEKSIQTLRTQIGELIKLGSRRGIDYSTDIKKLEEKLQRRFKKLYEKVTPWQVVQIARHPNRPIFRDYLEHMVSDFVELRGDRYYGNDEAIVAGFGKISCKKYMIIGQNKGRGLEEKSECNFGCTKPEGYRKAYRVMKLAEKYGLPVLTFIDTPGAYPGIEAEERGQARAIAENLQLMARLRTPIVSIIIGEGGSGGALGIGVGDKLAMLQFSYYSVISPEGCAAILWRDGKMAEKAAKTLGLTSKYLLEKGLIDDVIEEPVGGAQRNHHATIDSVRKYVDENFRRLEEVPLDVLVKKRYEKIMTVGKNSTTTKNKKRGFFFRRK